MGSILDPIADKVLIVSTYVVLVLLGDLPFWLLLLIVFRDLGIIGGYLILDTLHDPVPLHPSFLSKANTLLQIFPRGCCPDRPCWLGPFALAK
ncbi:MAG: hypothetical protein Ct9H300mP14_04950 [Gammaproteobacteria bacterium]|nr:MAG: hypothetical protein Ct9H300mP14_04950 [Gammaproteobacteria bacterium]